MSDLWAEKNIVYLINLSQCNEEMDELGRIAMKCHAPL